MAHENATPRPWFVGLSNNGQAYSVVAFDRDVATLTRREAVGTAFKGEPSNADAKLIVEAVNAFDTLRAEVARLEAENAKLREALKPFGLLGASFFHRYETQSGQYREAHSGAPDDQHFYGVNDVAVSFGDLRRARDLTA